MKKKLKLSKKNYEKAFRDRGSRFIYYLIVGIIIRRKKNL